MYIFELGRKARLVQQKGGRSEDRKIGRGSGFSSITQRDFDIGLLYIFLLADSQEEDFGDNLLYILYMGRGGAVSWTVTGPHLRFSSQLFIAKQQIIYFRFHRAG